LLSDRNIDVLAKLSHPNNIITNNNPNNLYIVLSAPGITK